MNEKISQKSTHAEREERIQAFWKEKGIFEKSLETPAGGAPKGDYTFYDGPPFATGLPHYGHILAGTIKDVIPRFKTMQGYRVRRRWGWDCHGLPVENLIEKELGLKSKKDIIDYGLGKFNAKAQESVMRYADEWRRIVPRLGRWVDMDDDYRTMDATYTESVWWIFKQLYDKGLIYEGFKSMNLCPHCGTTLSNFEVAQGYKDITDISVYAKFKITSGVFKDANIIAWTTTPWTLPGNVALAVNQEIEYVKVKIEGSEDIFILAKSRADILKDKKYEVIATLPGSDLVGSAYEPLFDYYSKDSKLKNKENGWKIYGADFVTTEDGTGVVHIAPAFGADDYELSLKHNLPFVQHVAMDGTFKGEVKDFSGSVKPKDTDEDKNAHQKADIEVIKWLAHNGHLFEKEKLIHSYPHCWRCETPLLNYATSSWFVKVTDIKDKLVAENKKITWVPEEVGSARFGNWLEGARDWAISRSRFWGAPIPVWKSKGKDGAKDEYHVIGSIEDIKKYSKTRNEYFIMRHGEAENNVEGILNSDPSKQYHLTQKGKDQVSESTRSLKGKIDLIYVSPLLRARETAEIAAQAAGLSVEAIISDDRLIEMGMGELEGQHTDEFTRLFPTGAEYFNHSVKGVETRMETKRRVGAFLKDIDKKHEGKRILIVSHDTPLWMITSAAGCLTIEQSLILKPKGIYFLRNAEVRTLEHSVLPHNAEYELDLHRPFIDDLELKTENGAKLERVPDVFDCWFESGSMPYAENNYPFCNDDGKKGAIGHGAFEPKSGLLHKSKGYPADFIAEGLDQTRGWFYSMLVLGVALFGKTPYKKVIVNGLVLAEDGQKMAKSKKNFPDPMLVVEKYGADSIRYYMLSSPVVRGQDLRFSEKGVDEVTKKLVNRLLNVVSFYELYKPESSTTGVGSKGVLSQNVLDQWVIARLGQTVEAVTDGLEKGELDRATRPLMDLVDDLSTWYLRRSRDRFKGDDVADKNAALETTRFVLVEMSKLLAPFMPFLAEEIYQKVKNGGAESVHLESWSEAGKVDDQLLESMKLARELSSKGLEARMAAKINVRQPLATLKVKMTTPKGFSGLFVELVKDEVNVKTVVFGVAMEKDVELDVTMTPELKEEGMVRELIRAVQDLRKEKGLSVSDKAALTIETDDAGKTFIEKNKAQVLATCTISDISFGTAQGIEIPIGDLKVKLGL
ncbi:MAG: class I tRNA ligase family protein [Patescibacteria group bacterium]